MKSNDSSALIIIIKATRRRYKKYTTTSCEIKISNESHLSPLSRIFHKLELLKAKNFLFRIIQFDWISECISYAAENFPKLKESMCMVCHDLSWSSTSLTRNWNI